MSPAMGSGMGGGMGSGMGSGMGGMGPGHGGGHGPWHDARTMGAIRIIKTDTQRNNGQGCIVM